MIAPATRSNTARFSATTKSWLAIPATRSSAPGKGGLPMTASQAEAKPTTSAGRPRISLAKSVRSHRLGTTT